MIRRIVHEAAGVRCPIKLWELPKNLSVIISANQRSTWVHSPKTPPTWEDWEKPRHHVFREWIFEPSILITKPKYFSVVCKVENICVEFWSNMHCRLDWLGPWKKEKGGGGWSHQTFFVLPTKPEASCSYLARLRLREWFIIAKINELHNTEEFGIRFAVPHQTFKASFLSCCLTLSRPKSVSWVIHGGRRITPSPTFLPC